MKLIPIFLLVGMLAVSGCTKNEKYEPYSVELVKKAEAGNAKSQYSLGFCYFEGEGITQDKKEAVNWFRKAAEQDDIRAQLYLADCYKNGEGVNQDIDVAEGWREKASNTQFFKRTDVWDGTF